MACGRGRGCCRAGGVALRALGARLRDRPRPQLQTWARLEEVRAAIARLEAEKEEVALAVHALVVSPPPPHLTCVTLCPPTAPPSHPLSPRRLPTPRTSCMR